MRHVLALLLLTSAAFLSGQNVVLSNATIIDGTGNPPMHHATIVIENGRIAQMGTFTVSLRPGTPAVDLTGKTIIPGIFNLHAHIDEKTPDKLACTPTTASPA